MRPFDDPMTGSRPVEVYAEFARAVIAPRKEQAPAGRLDRMPRSRQNRRNVALTEGSVEMDSAKPNAPPVPRQAVMPSGINHLVLNVRDIEQSHRFWTEILGFKQVGELHPSPRRPNPPKMRFYSGDHGKAATHHHDVALVENPDLPPPPKDWSMFGAPLAISHIALTLPSREAWLEQLAFLQSRGVKFDRRVDHGMTHSLYIHDPNGYGVELLYDLPRELWEGDIDAALNWAEQLPTEGPEALADRTDDLPVFRQEAPVRG
jgi:catechol-2,3-dioxygenase